MGKKLAEEGLKALMEVKSQTPKISFQKKKITAKLTNPLYKIAFRRKLLPDTRDKKGYITTEVNLIYMIAMFGAFAAWLILVFTQTKPSISLEA